MAGYSIDISRRADNDMRNIYSYIAHELKEPKTALEQIERIETAINSLDDMPDRIALVSDERLASEGYRKLLVDNYFVFYLINSGDRTVEISRVLYALRDWKNII
jgi:plasmid stabilization system protein ParE